MSTELESTSLASLTDLTATMSIQSSNSASPSTDVSTQSSSADTTPDNERDYNHGTGSGRISPSIGGAGEEEAQGGLKGEKVRRLSARALDTSDRRTVFIPNLPRETREREVRNMFAFASGFLKVQVYDQLKEGAQGRNAHAHGNHAPGEQVSTGGVPHTNYGCFILFETSAQALAARDHLHGYVFDATANPPVVLQARIAMKNLFLTNNEQNELMLTNKTSRRGSFTAQNHQNVIPPSNNNEGIVNHNLYANGMQSSPTSNQPGAGSYSPILTAAGSTPPGFSGFLHPHSPVLASNGYGVIPPALAAAAGYYSPTDSSTPVSPQHSPLFAQQMQAALNLQIAQMANGNAAAAAAYRFTNGHATISAMMQHQGNTHAHQNHHAHSAGPYNPPCTTLFLARLDALTNEDLLQMMYNSFPNVMKDHKFMIDSKGQRIAFVEFDSIESATNALFRMNNFLGMAVAFSKNPLNVRK